MTTAKSLSMLILVAALPLGGCATLHRSEAQRAEDMLETAGFRARAIDTPEQLASLHSMPPRVLVMKPEAGSPLYTYADPDNCRCVYVGGPEEYAAYQRLRVEDQLAEETVKTDPNDPWQWW